VTDHRVVPSEGSETSTGLLRRAILRESGAWEKLVALYGPLVYDWCRTKGRLQACDAQNVAQEVFLRVSQKLGTFRRDRAEDSFRGWLFAIARNCWRDHYRQGREQASGGSEGQKRFEQISASSSDETSREEADQEEAALCRRAVELIRGEFSERDWQAFQMVVLDGRPVADVVQALNVSRNVVYLARSRILARLKAEFGELLEF
jgi:RNA polymerase sigma-70 factor (ECF subfamily)